MPTTQHATGTQTATLDTDHDLATLTGPSGGGFYALFVDTSNLANGERLFVYYAREVAAGDGEREVLRTLLAADDQAVPGVDSLVPLRLPEGIAGTIGIRQEGGTGRDFPWAVERVDG